MQDNTDLQNYTVEYRKCCEALNKAYIAEKEAMIAHKTEEAQARIKYWEKLQIGEITKAIYDESIKNDTFNSKLEYEKAKISRKLVETHRDSVREKLYTEKKLYDIQ